MTLLITVGSYERILYGFEIKNLADKEKQTIKTVFAIPAHTASIRCMAGSSKYLATGGADEQVRLFDLSKRKDVGSLSQHQGTVKALVFVFPPKAVESEAKSKKRAKLAARSKIPTHLLSAGEDGRVSLFRTSDWECLHVLRHKDPVTSLAVHPSSKLALSVGENKSLRLWDLMTGKQAFKSTTMLKEEPINVKFSPDGNHFSSLSDFKLQVFSVAGSKSPMVAEILSQTRLACLAYFEPDTDVRCRGSLVFMAGDGPIIQVCNVLDGKIIQSFDSGIVPRIKAICYDQASHVLVAAGSSGIIRGWRVLISDSECTIQADPQFSHETGLRITCLSTQ